MCVYHGIRYFRMLNLDCDQWQSLCRNVAGCLLEHAQAITSRRALSCTMNRNKQNMLKILLVKYTILVKIWMYSLLVVHS